MVIAFSCVSLTSKAIAFSPVILHHAQGFPPATGVDLPPLKPLHFGSSTIDSEIKACLGVANTEADSQVCLYTVRLIVIKPYR